MNALVRRTGLGLVLVVIVGLLATGPASAAPEPTASSTTQTAVAVAPAVAPGGGPVAGPEQISTGGCGFLSVCIYLNRNEQKYAGESSVALVAALICTTAIACAASAAIATAVIRYVDRHGICPSSRPRLRVRVFPSFTGDPTCVS